MAISPADLAAGAAALSVFVSNAKYAEMIVDIAFVVVPTILGFGAAGLIGSAAINTAKEVMNSISLLQTLEKIERFRPSKGTPPGGGGGGGGGGTPPVPPPERRKRQQDQGKQEEQSSGGSGGSPPPPPDIKPSEKKEEQAKIDGIPIEEYAKKKRKEMGLE